MDAYSIDSQHSPNFLNNLWGGLDQIGLNLEEVEKLYL